VSTWVDSHCHLHLCDADPAQLVSRAVDAGVEWMVSLGTDATGSEKSLQLADQFAGVVFAGVGLHPHDASRWPEESGRIGRLARRAVAVGECGLDFYRNLSPRDQQIRAFREQAALAAELDKPLVVHCRDAFTELHDEVESLGIGPRTVLHCWTGGPRWTKRFSDLGVTFSFAGPITFDTGDTTRRAAAVAPRDRTMVETDSPYLTPPPDRRTANEPANVVKVGEALAQVWGMEPAEVARLTSATAAEVFRHA
jgi:TatD DNase family protein